MPIHIRILKGTNPSHTSGANFSSPGNLISGTAVPALSAQINTAAQFSGDIITVGRIFGSTQKRARMLEPVAKNSSSRRKKKMFETRAQFDMMPAYSERQPGSTQSVPLRAVNTPLSAKAVEEMSDFERKYPW